MEPRITPDTRTVLAKLEQGYHATEGLATVDLWRYEVRKLIEVLRALLPVEPADPNYTHTLNVVPPEDMP